MAEVFPHQKPALECVRSIIWSGLKVRGRATGRCHLVFSRTLWSKSHVCLPHFNCHKYSLVGLKMKRTLTSKYPNIWYIHFSPSNNNSDTNSTYISQIWATRHWSLMIDGVKLSGLSCTPFTPLPLFSLLFPLPLSPSIPHSLLVGSQTRPQSPHRSSSPQCRPLYLQLSILLRGIQ